MQSRTSCAIILPEIACYLLIGLSEIPLIGKVGTHEVAANERAVSTSWTISRHRIDYAGLKKGSDCDCTHNGGGDTWIIGSTYGAYPCVVPAYIDVEWD